MKQKKKIIKCLFLILIIASILYNVSFANEIKVYFANENTSTEIVDNENESEYSVDIYVDTEEKGVSAFQFQLAYPENLELIDVEKGDIENVKINTYGKKVIGYNKNNASSKNGKVKLCTLIFKIIEESKDGKYDIKINFSDEYSKIIDGDGKKIEIEESKEKNENSESSNNTENNDKEVNKNKSDNSNKQSNIQLIESEEKENKPSYLPQTGGILHLIIINIILIGFTILFGLKLIKYKKYDM